MVIGTRDWETVERFLRDVGPDETAELRETPKQHIRIVLQGGERWYLNLLVSETTQRSRITSMAAAKLGRGNEHEKRMHLRDVKERDVPITVDVVNTTKEQVAGESLPPGEHRPHMVLTPEDERRIQGMMLTGWKGKADLLKGWASQGKKKNQISQGIQSACQAPAGEAAERHDPHHRPVRRECAEYGDPVRDSNDAWLEIEQSQSMGDFGERKKGVQQDPVPGDIAHRGRIPQVDGGTRHAEHISHRDMKYYEYY